MRFGLGAVGGFLDKTRSNVEFYSAIVQSISELFMRNLSKFQRSTFHFADPNLVELHTCLGWRLLVLRVTPSRYLRRGIDLLAKRCLGGLTVSGRPITVPQLLRL